MTQSSRDRKVIQFVSGRGLSQPAEHPHISPEDRIAVAMARLGWDRLKLARNLEGWADDSDNRYRRVMRDWYEQEPRRGWPRSQIECGPPGLQADQEGKRR